MAEKMTLAQIVHLLRNASEDAVNPRYRKKFKEAADALEVDHLTQPAQAVDVDGLCHELWAMAQGPQPMADAIEAMCQTLTRAIGNAQNAEDLEIVTTALELCAARKEKAEKRLNALELALAEFWASDKPYEVEQVVTCIEKRADEIMRGEG